MAYLLRFDGVNDKVEITNGLTLSNIGDYIEIDVDFETTDSTQFLLGNKSGAFDQFFIYDTTRWRMRVFSGIAEIYIPLPSGRTKVKLELTGSGYELFYDGVSQGIFSQPAGFSPTLIGAWAGGSGYADIDLYGLIRAASATILNNYDPSASNGTGQILPDTVGGNDGTLVNFPTDDSQWIFYDDGGGAVTADAAYTIASPAFASTASATLPAPIADASFALAAPTFSVDADATLPQPSSDVAFTVNSPSFAVTATATEPGFNASVNFAVSAPTFAVDAAATLPQPSADVGFTVSAPTFSVVAIVGGIAIIVDNETNINLPVLSNNATAPALATNINAPVLSNNVRI